jgi:urate oxidase
LSPAYRYEIGYGKKRIPVYRTSARPLEGVLPIPESPFTGRGNALLAAEIDVDVYGDDFLPAYTRGDNAMVVATDSMKNFVIRETLAFEGATLEGLCFSLAVRFAETYPQLRSLRVTSRELPFAGVPIPQGPGFAPATTCSSIAEAIWARQRSGSRSATRASASPTMPASVAISA